MKHLLSGMFITLSLVLLAGCEHDPSVPVAPASGALQLNNLTSYDFDIIRYRESNAPQNVEMWSRNLMEDYGGGVLGSFEYVILRLPPGTYDLKLYEDTGQYFWLETSIQVKANQLTEVDVE